MKEKIFKILTTILLIPLFGYTIFFGWFQHMESFNIIEPTIDTVFTENYSEEKFDRIKIGMDSIAVVKILGKPFSIQQLEEQKTLWYYTGDGKCDWHDFAWLGREIEFDKNGIVLEKIKLIHYD
ncbi:hypothetical protein SCB49_14635 [unidentified eubacterium SCB49]|nr:hypothetical protein SCB49_14635 [unidentified eubacterium SCB49]